MDLATIKCLQQLDLILTYLKMILSWNGTIEIWSPYSAKVAECFMKASNFEKISLQHCHREANQVAHFL